MKDFLKTVFSYNFFKVFIYFIYVFSGSVKWIPFPIDITLFSFGICLAIIFFEVSKINIFKKYVFNQVYLILILIFLFILSNIYTISYIYSEKKNLAMVLNFFTILYPLLVFKKVIFEDFRKLMYIIGAFTIGILFYVYFTTTFIIFFDTAQAIEHAPTYLAVGIMLSTCFLFSLASKPTIPVIAYRLIILFLLTQLGGRGPLFNLILCLLIYYTLNLKNLKINYKVVLLFISVIFIIVFYLDTILQLIIENVNIDRFNLVKASVEDGSVLYRIIVLNKGLETFYDHPFTGLGIGSSGISLTGFDEVEYPHNLVVESLMELGIIGGIVYLAIYLYFFVYNLRIVRLNKNLLIFYIVSLLYFLEDMKSGSFDAWRISLMWVGVYLIQYNFQKIQNK
jgi:hypothetical protein